MSDKFIAEVVSATVWKVVEADRYGQLPFLYVVKGSEGLVLVDAGTGQHDYLGFVASLVGRLPFYVLVTHVHFDHVGGAAALAASPLCRGVLLGGGARVFSENVELNSLCLAHGAPAPRLPPATWLDDGEWLDVPGFPRLQAVHTPGHTPDSVALWYPADRRLFVGDNIYPYTLLHLDSLGSSPADWLASLHKLQALIAAAGDAPAPAAPLYEEPSELAATFAAVTGLTEPNFRSTSAHRSVKKLLALTNNDLDAAVNWAFGQPDDLPLLCPRNPSLTSASPKPSVLGSSSVVLSCGHVEANLPASSIDELLEMVSLVKARALHPVHTEDEFHEYQHGSFSVMLSSKKLWS